MSPWRVTCLHADGEIERRLFYPGDVTSGVEIDAEIHARAFYDRRVQSGQVMSAALASPYSSAALLTFNRGW